MDFPDTFSRNTTPLEGQVTDIVSQQALAQLAAKGFTAHFGLTETYADAIAAMARESAIREYCPNDSAARFKDRAATTQWLAKHRAVFLLLKQTPEGLMLAGYGWSGLEATEQVPGAQTTFALRVGELGQGQGLATPFAQLIIQASIALYDARGFWLETWASNTGAVHVYKKLGFQQVAEVPSQRKSADSTVPDTRLFMTLPK